MNTIIHKNIDENNRNEVLLELDRLRKERLKYNIDNIPRPSHIKREDFSEGFLYARAKDSYYESYIKQYKTLDDEVKRLQEISSELFYNEIKKEINEKKETISLVQRQIQIQNEYDNIDNDEYKRISRQETNHKYYQKNKDKLIIKSLARQHRNNEKKIKSITNDYNKHLINGDTDIIRPLCPCGRCCDLVNFKNSIKHSKITKHQLFKSIIRLIYYKRQDRKIKTVIDNINKQLIEFKKNVRVINHKGESVVVLNKRDKEILQLYNDMAGEIDENKYIIREPYINKVKYNNQYQDKVLLLKKRRVKFKNLHN